ncbi:hypothetical protein [Agrobacterium leguminum]|uniref:hypothetical protein n=1 Tax=Agrobacterium leguminum TaxID=2792015 RepID=UPI003CE58F85
MTKTNFPRTALALAISVIGVASAYHGFGDRYDLSAPIWVEGEVVEAYFGQPHAELTIRTRVDMALPATAPDMDMAAAFLDAGALVVLPETVGQTIEVELPPTQQYFGLGERIHVGDRVAIIAVRNCDEPHQLNGQWLRLADDAFGLCV